MSYTLKLYTRPLIVFGSFHLQLKIYHAHFKSRKKVKREEKKFIRNKTHHYSLQHTQGFCDYRRTWTGMRSSLWWLIFANVGKV